MDTAVNLHEKAIELGKLAVRMTAKAGAGHPSSALSLAHIVTYLLYKQMRIDPANPLDPNADRLVLSAGHAVPIVYAAWADLGGAVGRGGKLRPLTIPELDKLRARDSELDGHPNPAEGFPFFDAATGSLGMGLSVGAGLALAARRDGTPRRVYVIIGDGEAREGQIWEAADFIVDHGLANVCAIFNCNDFGQAGAVSPQQSSERIIEKLRAFAWDVFSVDGHDLPRLEEAFGMCERSARPLAIVARTIKGWGVDALCKGNWHGKPLDESALAEADASLDRRRAVAQPTLGRTRRPPVTVKGPTRIDPREAAWPPFDEAMRAAGLGPALDKGKLATRRAYGAALVAGGKLISQLAVLDGDVSNSTFTEMFAAAHPERFFECKIAEQNMISVGVGLAAAGYIPFANSFAKFISRGFDQVELASISRANLKIVGSHAGASPCSDGPSQMGLVDMAFFRAFTGVRGDDREQPLCWLFNPADAVSAYHCTRLMTQLPGMCYMRTYRPDVPLLYKPDAVFEPGGCALLAPGEDVALVSAGYMLGPCRAAAALLAQQGVRAGIIDCYSLPVNAGRLAELLLRSGGRALVVEDNYAGGLGSAVAEVAARRGNLRVQALCCQRYPKSTLTPEEELDYLGLSPTHIADHALSLLRQPTY